MADHRHLLAVLSTVFLAATHPATATDHIVGANHGWNPGVNYTLWANNQTFYVNDFISFRYQKWQYNVFMVNETGYDNCTIDGALGNWTGGKDFILLDKAQRYYFICGTGYCSSGMKVSVVVRPLASPPGASSKPASSGKEKSGGSSSVLRAMVEMWKTALCGLAIGVLLYF